MAVFVYITEQCYTDAQSRNLSQELAKLRDKIVKQQENHLDNFPPHYLRKRFARQDRLIAREQLIDDHVVVVFLGILTRGSADYEDHFLKNHNRDRFCNSRFGPPLTVELLRDFIDKETRTQPPPQKPRPSDEEKRVLFEVLSGAISVADDCFVCASRDWVRRSSEERVQDRLLLLESSLQQIVERKTEPAMTYLTAPGGQISVVYRHFPSCNKVFLAGVIVPGDTDPTRKGIETNYQELLETDDSIEVNELVMRFSERGYPSTILYGTDEWLAIEKEKGANLALSEEETKVLESAREVYSEQGGYPLFVNGRAGSGKSTILQYLFEEYLYHALFRAVPGVNTLPVYFACSEGLLRTSRLVVENLIRCSHRRQIGGVDARERERVLHDQSRLIQGCFQEFHEYLLTLLPIEDRSTRFSRSRRIDFRRFKELWRARFSRRKDLAGWNAEICWHALRSYIKGFSVDDYLDPVEFGELPRAERTVTDLTYKRIFDQVWQDWYLDLCEGQGYWDDQDLAREILNGNRVKASFAGVFCDEAQDFTRVEVELIHRMCLFSERALFPQEVRQVPFVFAGDPFQTLNPTGFRWEGVTAAFHEKLIKNLDPSNRAKATVRYKELHYNYRSTANIVRFTNLIQALRKSLFDLSGAEIQPQTHWRLERSSPVPVYYSKDKDEPEIRQFLGTHADVTIIVPCDEGEEVAYVEDQPILREVLKRDETNVPQNVISAVRAKGLEFNRVVLFGFGDAAPSGLLAPISGGADYAADRDRSLPFEYFMNRLYVGASRPRRRLFVIDSDNALRNFWAFARDAKVTEAVLQRTNEPERWRKHLCPMHPGLPNGWAEEKENTAENAESYEQEGMRARDPYLLRAAALQFESAGNKQKMKFCRAMAQFFEKNWLSAGRDLQDCGCYDQAASAFWNDGGREALSRLRQLAALHPCLRSQIEWQFAEWENGDKALASTLPMIQKVQESLADISFPGRLADDNTLRQLVARIFDVPAAAQTEAAPVETWKSLSNVLSKLIKLGTSVSFEARAIISYRAGDYAGAIALWKEMKKTAHAEYKWAAVFTSPYPANLQYLSELQQHEEIVRQFDEKKSVSIASGQLQFVVKAFLQTGHSEKGLRLSIKGGDRTLARETWGRAASQLSEVHKRESASEVLSLLMDSQDWGACIEFVLKDVPSASGAAALSASLQAQLIWAIARSASLPVAPAEVQVVVADYLSSAFIDVQLPSPLGVSHRVAGAAIERSGRIVAALRFYEKLLAETSSASDAEKFFARTRWVKVKMRQSEHDQRERKTKNAERSRNEALRMLNDLPLDKDPAKIAEFPSLSDDDKPQTAKKLPVEVHGFDCVVSPDATREIYKWSVGQFDFTFNQPRAFVVITSSFDGNTTRIDLAGRSLTGSLTPTSHQECKSYFKSWNLAVDLTQLQSEGLLSIVVGDPECTVKIHFDGEVTSKPAGA